MRGIDRAESAVVTLMLTLVLLWVPVCTAVGTDTFTSLQQQSRTLQAQSRPVPAVLRIDAGTDPQVQPAVRITDTGSSPRVRPSPRDRGHGVSCPLTVSPEAVGGPGC